MVLRICKLKRASHKFPSPLSRGRLAALLQPRKQYNNLDTIRSGEEEGDRSTPSHRLQEEYDTLRIPARKQLRGASRNTDRNSPRNRPRLRHSHKPRFWTNLRHTVDIAA